MPQLGLRACLVASWAEALAKAAGHDISAVTRPFTLCDDVIELSDEVVDSWWDALSDEEQQQRLQYWTQRCPKKRRRSRLLTGENLARFVALAEHHQCGYRKLSRLLRAQPYFPTMSVETVRQLLVALRSDNLQCDPLGCLATPEMTTCNADSTHLR